MKRFIAMMLFFAMMLGMFGMLSGCEAKNNQAIKYGQWLSMVNEAFGMESYAEDTPYFAHISAGNPFFDTVQIATEWEIITPSQQVDLVRNITWKDVLVTLVNAGGFAPEGSSEDEKAALGIQAFDSSIRKYWMNRDIGYSDAVRLLAIAQEQWANRTYDERVEQVDYKEGVKDFTDDKAVAEQYVISGDDTILPDTVPLDLKAGDVYVLPGNQSSLGTKFYKVESITRENGQVIIHNDPDLELFDIAESIFLQETLVPTAENTVIYDGNGNPLTNIAATPTGSSGGAISPLTGGSASLEQLADAKLDHEFEIKTKDKNGKEITWKVVLSYKLNKSMDMEVAVSRATEGGAEWEVAIGLDNVKVTNDIDYKWFKLRSASVKVDYETSMKFKVSTDKALVDKVAAPYNNKNGNGLANLKNTVFKDSEKAGGSGAQTIKLLSLDVWSVGVARICLDVNFVVKVDGSFEISITNHDSKGIEYKNKNLRFINKSDKDIDITAQAKIEATLGIGPALYAAGLKKPIIGVQGKFGAGATARITLHLADTEGHLIEEATASDYPPTVYEALMDADIETDAESILRAAEAQGGTYSTVTSGPLKLHADVCINIAMYWIIRIELTDTSLAASLVGGKIKLSKEFLGEKNGKFAYAHIENFDFIGGFSNAVFGSAAASADQCTKQYVPFDNAEPEVPDDTTATDDGTILQGNQITLAEIRASIALGQKYFLMVQELPEGYSTKDLKIKLDDPSIASVDENGVIVGKKTGSTIITVYTSDNKYFAYCALTVVDSTNVQLKPLCVIL